MKLIILFLFLISFCNQILKAQDPRVTPLLYQTEEMKNVTSKKVIFKTVNDTDLHAEIYYPPTYTPGSKLPVVIFNNGVGSFDIIEWKPYIDWAKLTASSGLIAVLHQSLPSGAMEIPESLVDFLVSNSADLQIDENRIGLFTSSANVNVGLPLAFQSDRKNIRCAVIYYGMAGEYSIPVNKRQDLKLMVVRAGKDSYNINNNIDKFVKSALEADMNIELINYLEGQHGFDIFNDNERTRQIIKQTIDFYKNNLMVNQEVNDRFVLTPKNLYQMIVVNNNTDEAIRLFRENVNMYRNDPSYNRFYNKVIDENNLIQIGYELINQKKFEDAVKVFQANAEAYPESPNVYDCLADAYEKQGKHDLAVQFAEKTLTMLPEADINEQFKQMIRQSAEDKIRRLKQ